MGAHSVFLILFGVIAIAVVVHGQGQAGSSVLSSSFSVSWSENEPSSDKMVLQLVIITKQSFFRSSGCILARTAFSLLIKDL